MAGISTASEVVKRSVAPVGRELGYLYNYHNNVEDVRSQLEKLGDLKGEVDRSVEVATRNGDDIDPDVTTWLQSANGIIEEARKFLDDEKNAEKRCFIELCPNLKSRYQFSKKAKKTVAEIVKIQDDGKFDQVSYGDTALGMGPTLGFEAFESRMSTLKGIMEALTTPGINMIGVYGKRGVGKTMLVKEVARKAQEDNLFDVVLMAIVSHPPNVGKIQEQIADKLGLKFYEKGDRAYQLSDKLRGKGSILVILDDAWAKLDVMSEAGIPFGEDYKGNKIVVTSENEDTLRNEMGAQMNFLLGALVEQEAWNFFKKMAGDSVDAPELKPTAIEIAKECVGLPLAVAAVANALKKKSLHIWKDALQQLRSSTTTNIDGMDAKVYSCLRLSYNYLESEEAKSLFLLSSLLPKYYHISIQDFLKYGKSFGLFQNIKTLEEPRNRVRKLIHKLKASCLLLDSDITGSVKMHDVIRDVGISLASKDKQISVVRNGVELEEFTKEEKLRICPAISLPYSDIRELPTGLECPKLKLFLLFNNNPSMKIPNNFFEGMKQLEVLNLTNLCFSSLPSLLPSLSNLQTLCLDQCMLQDIPIRDLAIIGEVKKLEILSFESSNIEELPVEIGQLSLLRSLDLRNCTKLKLIPPNVLASLSQLEDLYMGNSFVNWGVDGNASLTELERLPRLVTLDIGVTDPKILPKDLPFEKLMRYRIFVGDAWDWSGNYETSRTLKLKLNTSIQQEVGINMLLKRTEDLYLHKLKGIKSILCDFNREGFPRLKHLHVESSSEIEYVINSVEKVPNIAFPILKSLFLLNLNNLKEVCTGQVPEDSFRNLSMVKVQQCGTLKNVFSLSMARSLLQLQEIEITECKIMDEVVTEGREEAKDNNETRDKIMFPQLGFLTLKGLPQLVSFCSKVKTMPSIPLFDEKVAFQNLKWLNIENCDNLRSLFSPSMARDLVALRALKIARCERMEEIVEKEKGAKEEAIDKIMFPLLGNIILEKLPNLTSFNPGNHAFKCPSLKLMKIVGCPKMKTFTSMYEDNLDIASAPFFNKKALSWVSSLDPKKLRASRPCFDGLTNMVLFNVQVAFPILEELVLKSVSWKKIWNYRLPVGSFWKLKSLKVDDCNDILNIVPSHMLMRLQNLESLEVHNSGGSLECLFEFEGINDKERHILRATPLRYLYLWNLSSLVHIWKKDSLRYFPFQKLSILEVSACDRMRNIFTTSVAKSLVQLQELSISSCNQVTEIVEKEGEEEDARDKIVFPQVTSLTLKSLFQLESFFQGIHISEWPSLKKLNVVNCWDVEIIFAAELSISVEEERHGKGHVDDGTPTKKPLFLVDKIWKKDSQIISPFQNLTSLDVCWCSNLRNIFATSISKVEEIVEKEGEEEEAMDDKIVFPQLTDLILEGLPQLKSFCHGIHISEWPSLKKLNVKWCKNVEIIFTVDLSKSWEEERRGKGHVDDGTPTKKPLFLVDKLAFPKLEELEFRELGNMKQIWLGQFHPPSFCNLRVLYIGACDSLTHLLPSAIVKSLVQIESIRVDSCDMMEEIIAIGEEEATNEITLGQLKSLKLEWLPNLTTICRGSNTLSFPSLEEVLVDRCPKWKIFSNGILNAPKLDKEQIQHLIAQKDSQNLG